MMGRKKNVAFLNAFIHIYTHLALLWLMPVILRFELASILNANKTQDFCKLVRLKAKMWWIAIKNTTYKVSDEHLRTKLIFGNALSCRHFITTHILTWCKVNAMKILNNNTHNASYGENQEQSENSHRPPNVRTCLMIKIWIAPSLVSTMTATVCILVWISQIFGKSHQ